MHSTQTSLLYRLRQPSAENAESWARFVHIYSPLIFEFSRRLKVPASECQDVVQEMLICVLKGIPKFQQQEQGSFRGWLFRLLRNVWIDRLRRKAISAEEIHARGVALSPEDPSELIEEAEYRQYVIRRVYQLVVSEFSEDQQRLFQQLVIESQPSALVAERFGLSINALYLTRSRILKRIREELAELIEK